MPGVRSAKIDFDNSEALVSYDANKATIKEMSKALEKIGFSGREKSPPE